MTTTPTPLPDRQPAGPSPRGHGRRSARRGAMPLTVRVVGTYTMIVAATLLVAAGLALQFTRDQVVAQLNQSLLASERSFQSYVPPKVNALVAQGASPADALTEVAKQWLSADPLPDGQGAYVQVSGSDAVLAQSVHFQLPAAASRIFQATSGSWFTLPARHGAATRYLRSPVVLDTTATGSGSPTQVGTLVLAASQSLVVNRSVRSLLKDIGLASAIGLVFATILGILAVRRTLRPLKRMSREVESIQETDDLSKRLGDAGPADEVGRLAEGFDRMLGRLQESFQSRQRFLSDASHELRTPMTVVRGQLELLSMDIDSAAGRRSLGVALDELDRMSRIVEELLLLARLDEGMPLASQTVELALVVGEALLRGLPAPGPLTVDVAPDLAVTADADRLLQVVTNLVTNAGRHAPGAPLTFRGAREGDTVTLSIADGGPGISPADLPYVFDRLYRGARARAQAPGGAGLGLAIVASLVRAMGGSIDVASTLGAGTTFTVSLPAALPLAPIALPRGSPPSMAQAG